MPRPFAITAASNSVFLDGDRKGKTSFTVSNQSGRSIGGRAQVVTEEAAAEAWITLRGQAQRTFSTAGTEQYTVEIEVPPDAPSGSYTLRLDMVGEERPDEQYVEGPTVTFEVPEPEEEPEPFPWKIIAAIAVVLLVGGGVLAYQLLSDSNGTDEDTDTAVVPDVYGLTLNEALASLRKENLFGSVSAEVSDTVDQGLVIRTKPPAGDTVEVQSEVTLFYAEERQEDEAERQIADTGDWIQILSVVPAPTPQLQYSQPVQFTLDIAYFLTSADEARLVVSVGQLPASSANCEGGSGSLVDADDTVIPEGEGTATVTVTWSGGQATGQQQGHLAFYPSIWRTEGHSRIAYFGRTPEYCYSFAP